MTHSRAALLFFALALPTASAAEPARKPIEPVDLVGKAEDFFFSRNWNSYYWREDFSFKLTDEKTGKTWRIISREPTPAHDWRMGTTTRGNEPGSQ